MEHIFLADLVPGIIGFGRVHRVRYSLAGRGVGGDAHLAVQAGTREASEDLDQWVQDLGRSRLIGQR